MRGHRTNARKKNRAGQGDKLTELGREVGRAVEELAALAQRWWPPVEERRRLLRGPGPEADSAAPRPGGQG